MHAHTCIPSSPLPTRLHPPLPTHSPLYVHSSHSLVCAVCATQALSPEKVPAEMQTTLAKRSNTYLCTYRQTDRQTERGAQCLHVNSHRLLVLGLLCLLHTHTHNEDHDTHQVRSMSSQPKATPLSHSHTKQHTEGGRVQLPQHHVEFLLPPLFPPSSLLPRIHPLPSLLSVHIPSHCHCWLVSWGTSVAQTCSVSPQPRPVEHWSKWQPPG